MPGGTTQTGDSANFDIDGATGQIMTKDKVGPECGGHRAAAQDDDNNAYVEYTVVVRATDPAGIPGVSPAVMGNSDVVTVVIRVTDVNDAPVVTATGSDTPPTFAESGWRHNYAPLGCDLHCDRPGHC